MFSKIHTEIIALKQTANMGIVELAKLANIPKSRLEMFLKVDSIGRMSLDEIVKVREVLKDRIKQTVVNNDDGI